MQPNPAFMKNTRNPAISTQSVSAATLRSATASSVPCAIAGRHNSRPSSSEDKIRRFIPNSFSGLHRDYRRTGIPAVRHLSCNGSAEKPRRTFPMRPIEIFLSAGVMARRKAKESSITFAFRADAPATAVQPEQSAGGRRYGANWKILLRSVFCRRPRDVRSALQPATG